MVKRLVLVHAGRRHMLVDDAGHCSVTWSMATVGMGTAEANLLGSFRCPTSAALRCKIPVQRAMSGDRVAFRSLSNTYDAPLRGPSARADDPAKSIPFASPYVLSTVHPHMGPRYVLVSWRNHESIPPPAVCFTAGLDWPPSRPVRRAAAEARTRSASAPATSGTGGTGGTSASEAEVRWR